MASSARRKKQDPGAGLLAWYDVHRRTLPWRAPPGVPADPYRVWLSEIMLQQTTVQTVAPYYRRFVARWPSLAALAAAPLDDVLAAWAGLGYYARARNLHRTARIVAAEQGGTFPATSDELKRLPGIGPYTAGAIAAIAFGEREVAVDANAERVIARYFAIEEPLPAARIRIRDSARTLVPAFRAGDFAQALMDLGAQICTPRRPACASCPLAYSCKAHARGLEECLPVKAAKRARPTKRGAAFVAIDRQGAVLVRRRAESGLLGGMTEPPLGPWADVFPSHAEAMLQAPFVGKWRKLAGVVRHGFTHFALEIEVYATRVQRRPRTSSPHFWISCNGLADAALPTLMRKIISHGTAQPDRSSHKAASEGLKISR